MKVSLGFVIRNLHTGQMMASGGEVCEFYLTHPGVSCVCPRVWRTTGQAMMALTQLGQEMNLLNQVAQDTYVSEETRVNYTRYHLEWTTFLEEARIVEIFSEV